MAEAARSDAPRRVSAEPSWRQRGSLWCLSPERPLRGLIEFIGGSYLAASPQVSYRRLLEALSARGWQIHAWSYVPGFDHQLQANEAWRLLCQERQLWLDSRTGSMDSPTIGRARTVGAGSSTDAAAVLRLGHSLGCKLHLLAPDGGRGCGGLVALAFNNFSAERSVPLLAEMGQQFGFRSEFSPSPAETLRLVSAQYSQPRNLLLRFRRDDLDQSGRLLAALRQRPDDATTLLELPGDHLTPASAGLRRRFLGEWADDPARQRQIDGLARQIEAWWEQGQPR